MSLSDKRRGGYHPYLFYEDDVKEFIKELKEKVEDIHKIINKLAGEKLI